MRKSQRSRTTIQVAFALRAVNQKINRKRGLVGSGIINDWANIVGQKLAEHTLPEKLDKNGTLRIRVDSPIATEIQHLEPQILEKVAIYFGYRAARRLSIVQGPIKKQLATHLSTKALDSDSIPSDSLSYATTPARKVSVKTALAQLSEAINNNRKNG